MNAPETYGFYRSNAWIELRDKKLLDARLRCEKCGHSRVNNTRLEVHHICPMRERPDLALDFDNLVVLCIWCHGDEHPHLKKRYQQAANDEYFALPLTDGAPPPAETDSNPYTPHTENPRIDRNSHKAPSLDSHASALSKRFISSA